MRETHWENNSRFLQSVCPFCYLINSVKALECIEITDSPNRGNYPQALSFHDPPMDLRLRGCCSLYTSSPQSADCCLIIWNTCY